MGDLLRRPELTLKDVLGLAADTHYENDGDILEKQLGCDVSGLGELTLSGICEEIEISVKYSGYIKRQEEQVQQFKKLESTRLPENIDYNKIPTLSLEAREKLAETAPESLGQAGRISGVSPSDMAALLIYLKTLK